MSSANGPNADIYPQDACRRAVADWIGRTDCSGDVYLPSFTLCLFALRDGQGLEAAIPDGWRVLMPYAGSAPLLGQMTASTANSPPQMMSLSEGARAQAALDQLSRVQAMPEMKVCELRWLSIPGVMFEGFWLHSQSKDQPHLVSSVFTLDGELQGRVLPGDKFLPIVREYALWRLASDDRPDYGKGKS